MPHFFTIGVYGSTEHEFFKKLTDNHIDTFIDIRQRRGVRGAEYAFVNSQRLQARLQAMGIRYIHKEALAPTQEIRDMQAAQDKKEGIARRKRESLGESFTTAFENKVLHHFDMPQFITTLEKAGAKKAVLFCVEAHAEACHRALVAAHIADITHRQVTHL